MAIKVYIICALISSSTIVALVTEYLYFEILVNEDLCRVYRGRKVSVILKMMLSQKLRAFMHVSKLWICIVCCVADG
jgi:hypothetical protein